MLSHNTVKTASEKKVHQPVPEVVELAVALVLLDAVDDLTVVVGDLGDTGEFYEVEFDDENSVLRVGGLVI
jgi:hypothetical protein